MRRNISVSLGRSCIFPGVQQLSDMELVNQVAHGGNAAMTELVGRYEAPLRRYILRLCTPCAPYKDDLLQESFLKFYRNIHDFDASLKFSTWIYRIVHNVVIDHVRHHGSRPAMSVPFEEGGEAEDLFLGARFRPEEQVEKQEFHNAVQQILKKIPEQQRSAFVLRFFEEKEYDEIGDILKQNTNTIATWIRRAREIFRKEAMQIGLRWYWEEDHGSRR